MQPEEALRRIKEYDGSKRIIERGRKRLKRDVYDGLSIGKPDPSFRHR